MLPSQYRCQTLQNLAAALFEERPESLAVNAAVCSDFKTVHWKGVPGSGTGGIVEFMSEASGLGLAYFT